MPGLCRRNDAANAAGDCPVKPGNDGLGDFLFSGE